MNHINTPYGKIKFAPSGRFYERGSTPLDHNLLEDKKQREREFLQELVPFPLMEAKDAFGEDYDNDSDVPF